jgi:transcriptional regulator with XRE-family HTH domain
MEAIKVFATNVHGHRSAKGWSQEDLAERCGLHRTYISGIERGTRNPTISCAAAIAAAFGVRIADLFEERP